MFNNVPPTGPNGKKKPGRAALPTNISATNDQKAKLSALGINWSQKTWSSGPGQSPSAMP
ncbi:hypothetical protein D1AOALGA4SA_3409 [Olavius algarvensis Delta 1 endosymbiont]|nr:hypothetical protein D1AOALGA4SA_3409 [Olavius algarvensis Delta 1 endosymbiont]